MPRKTQAPWNKMAVCARTVIKFMAPSTDRCDPNWRYNLAYWGTAMREHSKHIRLEGLQSNLSPAIRRLVERAQDILARECDGRDCSFVLPSERHGHSGNPTVPVQPLEQEPPKKVIGGSLKEFNQAISAAVDTVNQFLQEPCVAADVILAVQYNCVAEQVALQIEFLREQKKSGTQGGN